MVLSHAVDPINDVPTLSITGTQATYEENSNSLTLLMANALVSDVDSSQYSGGRYRLRSTPTSRATSSTSAAQMLEG